jgi:hypothetical protein
MKLPRSGHGQLALEVIDLADFERPPMISIPEYLEKQRGAGAAGSGEEAGRVAAPAAVGIRDVEE